MPLAVAQRPSRSSGRFEDVLGVTRILAQLTSSATSIANVPIASQVASLVVTLLDITKGVMDNNDVRAQLASDTASYLSTLRPFLDDQAFPDDNSQELMDQLHTFCQSLLEIGDCLRVLEKQNILQRILAKERIAKKLLKYEKDLEKHFKNLHLWISCKSYPKDDTITRYDTTEVYPSNEVHALFANIHLAEISGNRGLVVVKRFDNKLERNKEAQKWRKLWPHPNIPHMMGMSKDKSPEHFILFHDNISRRSPYPGRVYSLAGHLIELSKDQEPEQILDTLVGYFSDVVSAVRHMQKQLALSENKTCGLANGISYYISPQDKRIVVAPPFHISPTSREGLFNNLIKIIFPNNGTNIYLLQDYFRNLDNFSTHASFIPLITEEIQEKWALIDGGKALLDVENGVFKRRERYTMPDTQREWVCNTLDIRAGDFGILYYSGGRIRYRDFRRVKTPITAYNAIFARKVTECLEDRFDMEFPRVCEQPVRWNLAGLAMDSNFVHGHFEELVYPNVYRSKRFLQLSAPNDYSEQQQLIFVAEVNRLHCYGHSPQTPPSDFYAELHATDEDELRFIHCPSGVSPTSFDLPLGSRVGDYIHDYKNGHIRIKYVTVPTGLRRNIANQTSIMEIQDREKVKSVKYKEYESILQHSPKEVCRPDHHLREWP